MDGAHQGIPGYAYTSAQCYDCHPTGEKGRFTEHDGQFFPIYSGAHSGDVERLRDVPHGSREPGGLQLSHLPRARPDAHG